MVCISLGSEESPSIALGGLGLKTNLKPEVWLIFSYAELSVVHVPFHHM